MNEKLRRTIGASTVAVVAGGLFSIASPHPTDVSAQGGSLPLRGGVQQLPDQEAGPRLFSAPSGEIFRIWHRVRDNQRDGGGMVILAPSADGLTWQPVTTIPPEASGVSTQDGRLAANDSGEIALVYRWWRYHPKAKRIRFGKSSDGGKTWTLPPGYVDEAGQAFDPQPAWGQGKTLAVAWADERQQEKTFQIYLRRSPDGGTTWDSEILLSGANASPGDYHTAPRLLGDGKGRFWLFWNAVRNARAILTLVRSEDDGRTWLSPQQISGDSLSIYGHSVSMAGNRMLATWEDQKTDRANRVYSTSSADGGVTWSPAQEADGLPATSPTTAAGPSHLLASSGEAWLAWHDSRNGRTDVFLTRSVDGGVTWGEAMRVDADGPGTGISRYPKLAMNASGNMAVVWEDDRTGFEAVYGRVRSGGRWSDETRLGSPLPAKTAARAPRVIATKQDAFYVVWEIWDYSSGPSPVKSLDGALVRVPKGSGS